MALAALTALVLCVWLGPRFIKKLYELKIGQPIRMDECPMLGELHKKKQDTPTMGGLLILASMLVGTVLWMDLASPFTWILALTTVCMGGLGAIDDGLKLRGRSSKGLAGKKKLLIQGLFAAVLAFYLLYFANLSEHIRLLYIPFLKSPVLTLGTTLFVLWTIFVVTGASNAVNLTDGLDGLAAGSLIMVGSTLAAVAFLTNNLDLSRYLHILYIEGSGEIAVFLAAMVGGCVGFLWYNGHPAQVFMGDTGSLALGAVLGVSAVLLRREFLLGIVGGVFVAEALSVMIQVGSYKLRAGKRVFLCAPLHHHFEYKGWPETKVVLRFWIVGLLLAIVGLASLKFQ
jgi:phospho-N-acetylmuramoyl-pentapeptide-transferase